MKYNNLGRAGIKLSELSYGSWLTFGGSLDAASVKKNIDAAIAHGINFFDNAEVYAKGKAEELMGEVLRGRRREDLVISTKIFWGGNGPNDIGLSWKHIVEGTRASLRRMRLRYVDLLYCHRPDPTTPIEETVRAMDYLVRAGLVFYWGTSEWSADQIDMAYKMADRYNCIPPTMEQPQYNMFARRKVELEFAELYENYQLGTTTWSPLCSGILSGKYLEGIPKGSRLDEHEWLRKELTDERAAKAVKVKEVADELGCTMAQLAIAWCLMNPNVSSVILGATSAEQLEENLGAIEVKEKLDAALMRRLGDILGSPESEKPF